MNIPMGKIFDASLLDQNGQILDTGQAQLFDNPRRGTFYPTPSCTANDTDRLPVALEAIGDQKIHIQRVQKHDCLNCKNYHFDY